jgi:hypothetical protein
VFLTWCNFSAKGFGEIGGYGYWLELMCGIKLPYLKFQLWTSSSNVGLLDKVEPDIAIIGDSYGLDRDHDWGLEHFLSNASSLNVENGSIPGGGSRAAPIKYFSIKNTTEKLAKFIVWPFALAPIPTFVFEEVIPSLSECKNPVGLTSKSNIFELPQILTEGKQFIQLRDFSPPIGVNLELKYSFANGESLTKVFDRKNAIFDLTESKNYYTMLPRNKANQNSNTIELNVPIAGSPFELCSLQN